MFKTFENVLNIPLKQFYEVQWIQFYDSSMQNEEPVAWFFDPPLTKVKLIVSP